MDREERTKKIAERNKQIRERQLSDIKAVLQKPEGRRLIWRIMAEAETFLATQTDKRVIGLMLFAEIMKADPESFLQMQREYKSEQLSIKKSFPLDTDVDD